MVAGMFYFLRNRFKKQAPQIRGLVRGGYKIAIMAPGTTKRYVDIESTHDGII
jgi:hypothetical protein